MTENIFVKTFKTLAWDLLAEVLYFPIWWYSSGLKKTTLAVFGNIKATSRNLALGLLFKNLFKPMYGQSDKVGRAISFFMRLVLLGAKLFVFLLFFLFYWLILIFWIVAPILVVWQLGRNFLL